MSERTLRRIFLVATVGALVALSGQALAQGLTLPPNGGNQKSTVIQNLGLVEVRIDYSSPDVTGPNGQSRRGQIWGQLVPYGLTNLGFGNGNPGPWRAGANENTVITFSHDVLVQGKPVAAGRYGLHMIAEEGDWTLILSNNSTSWGSFFYEENEDALRVQLKPEKGPFREYLAYDFSERGFDRATATLQWEELSVPFTIEVPQANELYLSRIRQELRDSPGFNWQNWVAASQFCVQNGVNLEEALQWAETAVSRPFVGQENFTTLQNKSQVLSALERDDEAATVRDQALRHRSASPVQIHTWGRQLQARGDLEQAVAIFELNGELNGEVWPVHVGLARAYSAQGDYEQALEHARKAHEQAPDQLNKGNLETVIGLLEEGKDFNVTN